jgi:hypothetical protein
VVSILSTRASINLWMIGHGTAFRQHALFFMRLPMSSLRVRPRVLVLRQSEIDAYGFTPILTFPRREGRDLFSFL